MDRWASMASLVLFLASLFVVDVQGKSKSYGGVLGPDTTVSEIKVATQKVPEPVLSGLTPAIPDKVLRDLRKAGKPVPKEVKDLSTPLVPSDIVKHEQEGLFHPWVGYSPPPEATGSPAPTPSPTAGPTVGTFAPVETNVTNTTKAARTSSGVASPTGAATTAPGMRPAPTALISFLVLSCCTVLAWMARDS